MFVVGLTGGIGSGKSTIAALFAAKGVSIIDTDVLARDLVRPDQPALKHVIELFGSDILLPDGQLDRSKLRKLIFSHEEKRKQLEQLLHPLIRAETKRLAEASNAPYCMAVIPLLFETEPNPLINRILIVDTSEELQILRTSARDKISPEDVNTILKTQISRAKRQHLADDIILNDGVYDDLLVQVDKLHALYLTLA